MTHPTMKYRPDIDGLRAIAIICTVGYHAFPKQIRGGFTGVDCFFVISGFLISGIIFNQLDKGLFSFRAFYARRIRRIFPAMLLMLTSIYVAGWWLMPSNVFEQLGKHIAAASGFAVNVILYNELGYFDPAAQTKPLLHLWSLGVEEQFYILWPTLVVIAWKLRWNLPALIAFIVGSSFTANVILTNTDQPFVFYCTLTRLWELLMGASLAYVNLRQPGMFTRYANVQAVAGSIILAIAVVALNAQSRFPGWGAALPVAGALLILSAGPSAWINRKLLSNRIMVWLGLISYPLYVWHWPLLSYVWVMADGNPSYGASCAAVSIAVILAGLTYHLLERNVRLNKHHLIVPWLILIAMTMFIIGMLTYGDFITGRNSFKSYRQLPPTAAIQDPQNLQKETSATATNSDQVSSEMEVFANSDKDGVFGTGKSKDGVFGTDKSENYKEDGLNLNRIHASAKTTLFIGDSHMTQYWVRIERILAEHPDTYNSAVFTILNAYHVMNPMIINDSLQYPEIIKGVQKFALRDDVDTVVIAAYWERYVSYFGGRYNPKEEDTNEPYISQRIQNGIPKGLYALEEALSLLTSSNKRVFLVLDNPTWPLWQHLNWSNDRQAFLSATTPQPSSVFDKDVNGMNIRANLKNIAACAGAVVIDPIETVCPQGMCSVFRPDGGAVYRDNNHLSASYCRESCSYMDITVQPRSERSHRLEGPHL